MIDDPANTLQSDLARQLRIVSVRHEQVVPTTQVGKDIVHAGQGVVVQPVDALFAALPQRYVGMTTRGRHPHEWLGHKACDQVVFARDLGTDLSIGREAIGVAGDIIEGPVELKLPGRVLMVTLDHVQSHGVTILDHLHKHRTQRLELIDVVAVGVRETTVRLAVRAALEPHHLGFGTNTEIHVVLVLKLLVKDLEVASTIGRQVCAGVFSFFAIAETNTEHAGHALVPGQLTECLRVGDTNQFHRLWAIANVIAMSINE